MELFYNILVYLGLRKSKKIIKKDKRTFSDIFYRKIIIKNVNIPKTQPRNITRELYKIIYNKDLSPKLNNREILTDIPEARINIRIDNKDVKFRKNIILFFSWTYSFMIFSILCFQPIYTLIYLISSDNKENFNYFLASFFFHMIQPTQYIFSIIYFGTDHFDSFYLNDYIICNCFPNIQILMKIMLAVVLFSSIFNYLVLDNDINFLQNREGEFPYFNELEKLPKLFVTIFLCISWILSKMVIYLNLICFTLVFCKHCKIIEEYVTKLEQENISNSNILTVNVITREVLKIRYDLEYSIDLFKNMFSFFTLFGAIGFGFLMERVKNGNFDFFPWDNFLIYSIVQMSFIIVIIRVSSYREKLSDYIRQPEFVEKFLKKYTFRDVHARFDENNENNENYINKLQMVILNMEEENSSTLDWTLLNNILNEKWTEFTVMGIEIGNITLIKQGIALVAVITAMNSFF